MPEREFYEWIAAICNRPRMYTPTGSFYEVASFLEGFGSTNVDELYYHSVFTPFQLWLEQRFNLKGIFVDWKVFRHLFDSDSEAIKQLPILYKEYLEYASKSVSYTTLFETDLTK